MRRGLLLINTGSPASPEVKDVKKYLTDFLTDPRIINMPKFFRHLLVKGLIAPQRAPHSAEKYRLIWREDGFPLQVLSDELADKMSSLSGLPAYSTMRYNEGSVEAALEDANERGLEEVVIIPLFPHYAMSSFESAVAHVVTLHNKGGYSFSLKCVRPYFDYPAYIDLLAAQVAKHVTPDTHLLISYHGIPVSQAKPYEGDYTKDYEAQCIKMTELLLSSEQLKPLKLSYDIAFQSRLGHSQWLTPATNERIIALAKSYGKIAVLCPSFVCDNLETSWEIDIQERKNFMEAGGTQFTFIPCPNASDACARTLLEITESDYCTDAVVWTKP